MESHIAARTEENIRAGMTPEEARRHGPPAVRGCGDDSGRLPRRRGPAIRENLLWMMRYAVRVLRKISRLHGRAFTHADAGDWARTSSSSEC